MSRIADLLGWRIALVSLLVPLGEAAMRCGGVELEVAGPCDRGVRRELDGEAAVGPEPVSAGAADVGRNTPRPHDGAIAPLPVVGKQAVGALALAGIAEREQRVRALARAGFDALPHVVPDPLSA